MKTINFFAIVLITVTVLSSCRNNNAANSTPIDSTNVNGTAPVTSGGNNPAHDADSVRANSNDTGSKPSNLHYEGYDSAQKKKHTK